MQFPYITEYVNTIFQEEEKRWDYIFLRPILIVFYFFLRTIVFPIKFIIHRKPWGFESYCIDFFLSLGTRYLATHEAAELFIRHVQIEPIIYRHLMSEMEYADLQHEIEKKKFNGIFGDFNVDSLKQIRRNALTIGHDELSYEIGDNFSRDDFLSGIERLRGKKPINHEELSKKALEENKKHSFQLLGATNVVILIVITITIFGDLRTTVKALNSFDSDSIVLWCMRMLYKDHDDVLIDLDFYLPEPANRNHYNSSVFFSDPSQYLYGHIAFDEYVYHTLMSRSASSPPS